MENRGIEGLISWVDRAGKVEYDVSFNMTYAKNKLLFWDETPGIPDYQKRTGMPVNTELWYIADGVFNTQEELDSYPHWANARTGDIKFVDVNGDGVINADDRVRSDKNSEPRFVFGLSTGLSWNNFDLRALFQGATGGITYIWRERAGEAGNYYKFMYENRWTEENPMVEHPRAYNRENEYWAKQGTDEKNTYYSSKRLSAFEKYGNRIYVQFSGCPQCRNPGFACICKWYEYIYNRQCKSAGSGSQ